MNLSLNVSISWICWSMSGASRLQGNRNRDTLTRRVENPLHCQDLGWLRGRGGVPQHYKITGKTPEPNYKEENKYENSTNSHWRNGNNNHHHIPPRTRTHISQPKSLKLAKYTSKNRKTSKQPNHYFYKEDLTCNTNKSFSSR